MSARPEERADLQSTEIVAEGLVKEFTDGPRLVRVLSGVDLQVASGETVAIVGESGVGKSTLLHILGGLDLPTTGRVQVGGQDPSSGSASDRARFRGQHVGFVFQFHHLLADFSAFENVMLPCLIAGVGAAEAHDRAESLLKRVGLSERLDHRPGELSGGEQQRVAVARALAPRPSVLLADEPTGNLDPDTAAEVEHLLIELNREQGVTCVVVTHSERLAAAMDRRVRLEHGRLLPA